MDHVTTTHLAWLAGAVVLAGLGLTSFHLARLGVPAVPALGQRGVRRQRAMDAGGFFGAFEPAVRVVAGWVSHLRLDELRRRLDDELRWSGYWLGLTADELLAMSGLTAFACGLAACVAVVTLDLSPWVAAFAYLVGAAHPTSQLRDAARLRQHHVERRLPDVVDLVTLCMSAGLDFPAALRKVLAEAVEVDTPIHEEVRRILDELNLGHTRRRALEGFADRVPARAVGDFVGAIVQAEEKGTSLVDILAVQARMLRMRRSVLAEEAAAHAAMKLMVPLVLIFGAIMILILGPIGITLTEI